MQTPIEIRYEGTVIGTATSTSGSIDDGTLYLATAQPMPVGTRLELATEGNITTVRVVRVAESAPGTSAGVGMMVRALGASEPLEIPMPPVAVVPPRPVAPPSPSPPPRPMSSPSPTRAAANVGAIPTVLRTVTPASVPTAPAPASAKPLPTPPSQPAVKGEIHRPSRPEPAEQAVPEPIGGSNGEGSMSVQIEMSEAIDSNSTAELPSLGNGNGAKNARNRRSRRKR